MAKQAKIKQLEAGKTEVGGATPFIDAKTAYTAYTESKLWMWRYYEPLDEFERIARNRPSPKIDPTLPRITDGTMASIIQEQPKRIIQQLASGKASSPDYPEYAAIADIVLNQRLVPMYNRNGDALTKQWIMLGKAMTYGLATSYTFFTSTNGKLHTDFVIPYVKDVILEKGKVYAPDSNICFMRSWYQKRDLQAIINKEKQLMAKDPNYVSGWDLKLMALFMEQGPSAKPADVMTPAEKEKGADTGGYEVIHAFQTGKGAEFYSFSPRFQDGVNLRTKITRDPRGRLPLDFLYCNIDLSNPLGRGQVELSGGIQNLLDQQLQMFQFMTTLEMGPPLQVWGNVNKASLKFRPNALWDMGSSANNKIEPYVVSNGAMSNFANNMQLLQSKIFNINASQDTSVASANNTVNQSKTSAGVKNQVERLGVADNYLRKQAEGWIQRQSETSMNIFFSEMNSQEKIEIGPQQVRELSTTRAVKFIKRDKDGSQYLDVNYKDIQNCVFDFQVDPDSSKTLEDAEQVQKLQQIIQEVGTNRVAQWWLGLEGKKLSVGELYNQLIRRLGLENLDSILIDLSPEQAQQAQQAPFPIIDMPKLSAKLSELPPAAIPSFLQAAGMPIDPQVAMQPSAQFQWEMARDHAMAQRSKMDSVRIDSADLTPYEKSQILQRDYGIQPDPTNVQPGATSLNQQKVNMQANDSIAKAGLNQDQHDFQVQKAAVDTALSAHQQAHGQKMDAANLFENAMQNEQNQSLGEAENYNADMIQQQTGQPQFDAGDLGEGQPTDPNAPFPANGDETQVETDFNALTPEEIQVVQSLLQRGFDDNDAEQAIVMLRQGVPVEQIIKALGQKRASYVG